jgi:N-methylhydantoinase A
LEAARVAEKLGLDRVLVPSYAGVGSAVGFLRAPIAYEIARSSLQRLDQFDTAAANAHFAAIRGEAEPNVRRGAGDTPLTESRSAFMRYRGQGHEIAVPLPTRSYRDDDAAPLRDAFESEYRRLYSRVIPLASRSNPELGVAALGAHPDRNRDCVPASPRYSPEPARVRSIFDPEAGEFIEVAIHDRRDLNPGAFIPGPAVITEDETSTVDSRLFDARLNPFGYIELARRLS